MKNYPAPLTSVYVRDLYSLLRLTKADELMFLSTKVRGSFDENLTNAHLAGFDLYIHHDPGLAARHLFSECYLLVRRKGAC